MLLIIAPDSFLSAAKRLKEHKERTGVLTTVVSLSAVYGDYQGRDEAEKVKRCIAALQRSKSIRYVLLMGDSDIMPVRYTKTDRGDEKACDTAFYATDLYYAALYKPDGSFDDWDANHNGYFGELHGETHTGPINIDQVTLSPTVAVGRVPASFPTEIDRYVDKIIRYETQAVGASWPRKAALLATHDWSGQKNACSVWEKVAQTIGGTYTTTLLSTAGSPCASAGSLTAPAVTQTLNQGVGLVGYIGHGRDDALAIPGGAWSTKEVQALTNDKQLPVMVVSACNSGGFATQPPYHRYTDVHGVQHPGTDNGESFTTVPPQPACLQSWHDPDGDLATAVTVGTPAGAIAYVAGVTGMQYSEPAVYLVEAMRQAPTLGDAWIAMVKRYYQSYPVPAKLTSPAWHVVARAHQPWKFMLFGDPSLRIVGAKRGVWSPQQLTSVDRGTSHGPALAVFGGKLVMVWKGKLDDPRIFDSSFVDNGWSPQQLTSVDRGTSDGPALATLGNKLVMVWKGKLDDPRIFYSTFDGTQWSPQALTRGDRGTSHGPAVATFGGKLVMVWKGMLDDPRIFSSTFDGTQWSPQALTRGDRGTSHGPALATLGNKLVMVWKGKLDDPRIFSSTFDGTQWSPQALTRGDRGTSHGPAVATFGGKLVMVWKGKYDDPRIFFSYLPA
jgi:hypothetical protein